MIGMIILVFILNKKDATFDYFPSARVLKDIRNKQLIFSENSLQSLAGKGLDTSYISLILNNGKFIKSESDTSLDSCRVYMIRGRKEYKNLKIKVENCDKQATVLEATFQE